MINFLASDKIGVLIEAGVPEGTQVAHKHGWITEPSSGVIQNISDSGIIYTPGGNYVLVIYAYHPPMTTALSGAFISMLRCVPLVLDVNDLWPDSLRASGMVRNKMVLALAGRI
jgi:hypothetical protein